ncbi:MAG TPA: hypothetical protein VGG19_20215 [Tepidisphaeraceae bacterium]|jgi:hypothetical protein
MKIAAIILAFASATYAAAPWQLTSADLHSQTINLKALNADSLDYIDTSGHPQHLPLNQFVQLQHENSSENASSGFIIILNNGQRYAGTAQRMTGDQLSWQNPLLGNLTIPVASVLQIHRPDPDAPRRSEAAGLPPTEDIIHLTNGDIAHGAISAMSAQNITIQTSTTSLSVPWSNVATVEFASIGNPPPATQPTQSFQIALDDGSTLQAAQLAIAEDAAHFITNGSAQTLPLSHITNIEQLNGPVLFLASVKPIEQIQTPLLGDASSARYGSTADNTPLPNAISVHAYSQLQWAVPPDYRTVHVQYAVPSNLPLADIVLRVKLDDRTVSEKTHLHAGANSIIDVPLGDARRVTLEADTDNPYRVQGFVTWLSPALIK